MSDIERIQQALERYYRKQIGEKAGFSISDVRDMDAGTSHDMYCFQLEYMGKVKRHHETLILRMSANKDDLKKEFQALEKLRSTDIPVPKVYDTGENMLGSSFIIMERVDGQAMWRGGMDGLTQTEEAKLWERFSSLLADIHRLDWKKAGMRSLHVPEGGYGYIDRWLWVLKNWIHDRGAYDFEPVVDWLAREKPASEHYVLLHGDYHPNNALVSQGEIVAIVDWEGVSIGDAAYDACEIPLLFNIIGPYKSSTRMMHVFLEHYRKVTGRELKNLDYYEILKATIFLFIFVMRERRSNWDVTVIRACAKLIEERTGSGMFLSLV